MSANTATDWSLNPMIARALACLLATFFVAGSATASDRFDLRDWLQRPGVRAVAVEFYATWCSPCMRAVPRWKALHEKYRKEGLRLVVINTQDPEGRCVNPGWNPDQMICDEEGNLAKAWGVGQGLPAAFVWSWQGNLLVRKGHVEHAETALQSYLRDMPRVTVQADGGAAQSAVSRLRERLTETGKLVVVAGEEERKALDRIRKNSQRLHNDQAKVCKAGHEVPANALLKVSVNGAKQKRLGLTLFSAESACALAATSVPWDAARPGTSVAEAVDKLLGKMRGPLQMPNGKAVERAAVVETDKRDASAAEWAPEGDQLAMVSFVSTPPGAMVLVDNKPLCQTPCDKALAAGNHRVAMHKPQYVSRDESAELEGGQTLRWRLEPDFAELTVTTDPEGVAVSVDGKVVDMGVPLRLSPGGHKLVAGDDCHAAHRKTIDLKRGERRVVKLEPVVKPAGLLVMVSDKRGSDVRDATVWVDGKRAGSGFKALKVPACAKEAEVRHRRLGTAKVSLALTERKTARVRVTLGSADEPEVARSADEREAAKEEGAPAKEPARAAGAGDVADLQWISLPGGSFDMGAARGEKDERIVHRVTLSGFDMARTEVTVRQYRACVEAKSCTEPGTDRHCNWQVEGREEHPINCVTWDQAVAFSRWVGGMLPTEAQWEYAARSAGGPFENPWGEARASCERVVLKERGHGCGKGSTWPVCSKPTGNTKQGLCDMVGNLWEWTGDHYAPYDPAPVTDPKGPASGEGVVLRGGAWNYKANHNRGTDRYEANPLRYNFAVGFRPVR